MSTFKNFKGRIKTEKYFIMSICVNASICRCHRGGLSRAQEWCGAGLVAPLVACGPNRTNELAAVLLWREDRRQGVRTTPARRGPRELLIGICWDGGTQCQGHPSIHLTDLTKQCWCLEFRCCGALLVAESGWYQFQSNYCSKKFCPGIFVYCPLVAVCHPFCICVFCNCICFFVYLYWLWILFFCPLVAVCHPSVGADWPESDIWKYFHQIASPNWQH